MSKTKLQDESKRKFLKYTALAALGIGAGYALSQATGADRMALAASPIETGWVLNNEIAIAWKDTGGTVRNALYLDGSNNLQIGGTGITDIVVNNPATFPALGIVLSGAGTGVGTLTYADSATSGTLTFPAVTDTLAVLGTAQTFTAAQTFNGGIIFDAAGSIAATSTFIEADGAGGNAKINVPTGKQLQYYVNGSEMSYINSTGGLVFVGTDPVDVFPIVAQNAGNLWLGVDSGNAINFRIASGLTYSFAANSVKTFASINTVGLGLPAEFASTLTSAVAIGTTSTVIKTYTPTADGQFLVVVSVEASVASTISSLTVTYTDATSGVSTTQTLATSVAVALNNAVTFTALCNATTASAISVQATAAAGTDLYASATVLAL